MRAACAFRRDLRPAMFLILTQRSRMTHLASAHLSNNIVPRWAEHAARPAENAPRDMLDTPATVPTVLQVPRRPYRSPYAASDIRDRTGDLDAEPNVTAQKIHLRSGGYLVGRPAEDLKRARLGTP